MQQRYSINDHAIVDALRVTMSLGYAATVTTGDLLGSVVDTSRGGESSLTSVLIAHAPQHGRHTPIEAAREAMWGPLRAEAAAAPAGFGSIAIVLYDRVYNVVELSTPITVEEGMRLDRRLRDERTCAEMARGTCDGLPPRLAMLLIGDRLEVVSA